MTVSQRTRKCAGAASSVTSSRPPLQALHLAAEEGVQEPLVVAKRHAADWPLGPSMYVWASRPERPCTEESHRREANGAHAVEQGFPLAQIVADGRRGDAAHAQVGESRLVHIFAEEADAPRAGCRRAGTVLAEMS